MFTKEYLDSVLTYSDGELYWKKNNKPIGKTIDRFGYRKFQVNYKTMFVHRIVFAMHNGYFPEFIDHVDGNKLNNKFENLRAATSSENNSNKKAMKTNKIGIKNVCWIKSNKRWRVQIVKNGKHCVSKDFADLELAMLVAVEGRDKFHGNFANHRSV